MKTVTTLLDMIINSLVWFGLLVLWHINDNKVQPSQPKTKYRVLFELMVAKKKTDN